LPRKTFAHKTFAQTYICPEIQLPKIQLHRSPYKHRIINLSAHSNDTLRRLRARDKGIYVPPETHVTCTAANGKSSVITCFCSQLPNALDGSQRPNANTEFFKVEMEQRTMR
jgi:hypothetical protein